MKRTGSMAGPAEEAGTALGRHMTVEFYECDSAVLADAGRLEEIFLVAAKRSGATVIDSYFHEFKPQGVSGVVVISESHFAVHAWPEHDYAAVDLFTCGDRVDFDVAIREIAAGIGSAQWIVSSMMNRGIVGTNGVERLVPVTEGRRPGFISHGSPVSKRPEPADFLPRSIFTNAAARCGTSRSVIQSLPVVSPACSAAKRSVKCGSIRRGRNGLRLNSRCATGGLPGGWTRTGTRPISISFFSDILNRARRRSF